jgi:mannose-6-phosphate isomerase-like protein (cupin superfamily)
MVERELNRVRERGAIEQTPYEIFLRSRKEFDERQNTGPIVIRPSDREYQITRQGRMFYYLNAQAFKETPLHDWRVFTQDIKTHSGKHRHQGGFVIYVIEGRGYSIVDGERVEWEEGDLFLLPIKPNGIEHQHFNTDPSKGCRWIAFCYMPIFDHLASEFTQMEVSPLMKG